MNTRLLLAAAMAAFSMSAQVQTAQTALPDDDMVVAVINGKKTTAGEIRRLVASLPTQGQRLFEADPKRLLQEHAAYLMFQKYAEEKGLDKISPYRETLEFYRMSVLNQAASNYKMQEIRVGPEEQQEYYNKNKEQFREAKVMMLYFPFTGAANQLAEGESQAKATQAVKRIRAGEDVAKVAKDLGADAPDEPLTVTSSSAQPPPAMREVILKTSAKSVTEPLRHENGYYVFRVESTGILSYDRVRDDIYKAIRDARFNVWMNQVRSTATVQFENEAFFKNIGNKGK